LWLVCARFWLGVRALQARQPNPPGRRARCPPNYLHQHNRLQPTRAHPLRLAEPALTAHSNHSDRRRMSNRPSDMSRIREVWAENLEEEMAYIRHAIQDYPFVAMVSPTSSSLPGWGSARVLGSGEGLTVAVRWWFEFRTPSFRV